MNSGRAVRPLPRGRRNGILDRAGALSPYIKHRGPGLPAAREDTDVEGTGARILIVEDDADINRLLTTLLSKEGYTVIPAYSGSEAEMRLQAERVDLVLLDLMLPGLTGEELLARIRRDQVMPVIVLSAKGREDKLRVLADGADDFIGKPFDVEDVKARVAAQLRRYTRFAAAVQEEDTPLHFKNLVLDPEGRQVTVKGREVSLTAREYGILSLLPSHPKKVFTRANLFESVWEDPYLGDDNTVNVHISNLRAKLAAADPDNGYIKTVWGIGFKMQED